MLPSIVQSLEVSSSLGLAVANATVSWLEAIGTRKSPNGLNGTVVPMNSDVPGVKIGSAAFMMRLNLEMDT
jgi:hypothetical protein